MSLLVIVFILLRSESHIDFRTGLLQLLDLLEKVPFFVFAGKTGKQYHFSL